MTGGGEPAGDRAVSEAAIAAWEDPPRVRHPGAAPVLSIAGFAAPLDWLLEMVRAEKIDLARLSIAALIEAFASAMTAALTDRDADRTTAAGVAAARTDPPRIDPPRIDPPRIDHWAVWTVMAASLTELWSRLLLPRETPAAQEAADAAEALRRHLLERARMQAAAAWLDRRAQLGRDRFARGRPDDLTVNRGSDLTDLLRACLLALQVPPEQVAQAAAPRRRLWQPHEAIQLLRDRLATLPDGQPLDRFLPALLPGPHAALRQRAALASTLVAGLELARADVLTLEQDSTWAAIRVTRRPVVPAAAAAE
jgi:segregation and condensation protein A